MFMDCDFADHICGRIDRVGLLRTIDAAPVSDPERGTSAGSGDESSTTRRLLDGREESAFGARGDVMLMMNNHKCDSK